MVINAKQKGSGFEREAAKVLNEKLDGGDFKRIYGSGGIGTTLGIPDLVGDINGSVPGLQKKLKIEAKCGYRVIKDKEVKSVSLRKEWFDKIKMEAAQSYGIPLIISKFDNVRDGTKYFVALDLDTFAYIINEMSALKRELDLSYEERGKELEADKKPV